MPQIEIHNKRGRRVGYRLPFENLVEVDVETDGRDEPSANEKALAVANKLLALQRGFALDHERGGEMFHGAALIKTRRGRYFLQANIHLPNTEITRNCAETNSVTEARGREGERLEVADLWFMGGKANYEQGQPFIDGIGKRYSPCGSCLDVIYNSRLKISGDTIVHMIPLNDGTMKLLPGDPDDPRPQEEIEPNRVFSKKIKDLLPHVTKIISDTNGAIRDSAKHGYDWLKNGTIANMVIKATSAHQISIDDLQGADPSTDETKCRINEILMREARAYYQDAEVKPTKLSVAIVRDANGNYYLAKHANNGKVMATPNACAEAIGRMIDASVNSKLKDLFLVEFNEEQLASLETTKEMSINMPDGATRELIKKAAKGTAWMTPLGQTNYFGAKVHIYVPNNPDLNEFSPKTHIITHSIQELLPLAYSNPKGQAVAMR
jgi:cytidine deaminase